MGGGAEGGAAGGWEDVEQRYNCAVKRLCEDEIGQQRSQLAVPERGIRIECWQPPETIEGCSDGGVTCEFRQFGDQEGPAAVWAFLGR